MAEEKNFEPSSKKKKKAKKEGQFARSREITQFAQLTTCYCLIYYLPFWCHTLIDFHHKIHKNSGVLHLESNFEVWNKLFQDSAQMVLVFGFALVLVTLMSELAQAGVNISFEKIKPKLSNINPVSGVRKIFGGGENGGFSPFKLLSEILQLVFLGVVISGILWMSLLSLISKLMTMNINDFANIIDVSKLVLSRLCLYLILVSLCFGIFKYYLSRKSIRRQLMMSFEELKQEYKDDEGDPQTKSERKAIHQELLLNGAIETVKNAKVIISDF